MYYFFVGGRSFSLIYIHTPFIRIEAFVLFGQQRQQQQQTGERDKKRVYCTIIIQLTSRTVTECLVSGC